LLEAGVAVAIAMIWWTRSVLPLLRPRLVGLAASAGVALLAFFVLLSLLTPDVRALYVGEIE
jgi:hypothetical protein